MAAISEHCRERPFQVATSNDPSLPLRKWDHIGTRWARSHGDAAHLTAHDRGIGGNATEGSAHGAASYAFPDGTHIRVSF